MKNKTTKVIVNGVILAAVAVIGVTAYQLGTSPAKEETIPEEIRVETAQKEDTGDTKDTRETEEETLVDAGTSRVEAGLEENTDDFNVDIELAQAEDNLLAGEEANAEVNTEAKADSTEETGAEATDVSAGALSVPVLDFSEDTLMEWPVNGNILLDYSMDQSTYFPTLDQYKLSPAIAVQAVEGAPVMAAAAGTVFSIEQDAQTGTTVTMELGNGYQAVYGQLTDLTVTQGDTVKEGAVIGYISTPTKYYSREGSNLYFAMKKDGKPIDPILYLP